MDLRYPIGTQTFEKIVEGKMVYVDKTDIIYNLVNKFQYVFLSRPRRFGKSLLLSTIGSYFEGRRDLFEGLEIGNREKDWKKHPVLHLLMSRVDAGSHNSLVSFLDNQFNIWEQEFDVKLKSDDLSSRFSNIITGAFQKYGEKVVILIDEYDNPLINTIGDEEKDIHERNRKLLKSIYSNIKDLDRYIRFAMFTGVSRFSRTSIFSGLNNLKDISFEDDFAAICGFTKEEIVKYIWPGVVEFANKKGCTPEEALETLKDHYDGYHFSEDCPDIYNPFSLLNALCDRRLGDYWILSGTPEFLVRKLGDSDLSFADTFNSYGNDSALGMTDSAFFSPVALLYQTGYLTIKGYDREENLYRLGVPNREVNFGLFSSLLSQFARRDWMLSLRQAKEIKKTLIEGRPEEFMERLKSFFAGIPFSLNPSRYELNFEKILYSLMRILELDVHSEAEIADGRIDILIKTDSYIYIIELKLDKSPEEALRQIEEKDYALPYKFDRERLFKIGVAYSSETRNITGWLIR